MILQGNDQLTGPSFSLGNRALRLLWNIAYVGGFRFSPRFFHGWRRFLLRLFGARLGKDCRVYASARIWAPWNLTLGDHVRVGERAILYSMSRITVGDYATVSQGAHLCCGTHDYNSATFQLIARPIEIGKRAWVCAEVFVHPGVSIPEGAVVGARAVVTRSLSEPWVVYAGNPARKVGTRRPNDLKAVPTVRP